MKISRRITTFFAILGLSFSGQTFAQSFVGMGFDFVVTNPAAVVSALDKYNASINAQNRAGYPVLNRYVVNGENPATHNIVTIFPSLEALDNFNAVNANSQDWIIFQAEMAAAATLSGELFYQASGITVGDQSIIASPNYVSQYIMMDITDPEKYVDAWMELAEEYQSEKVYTQLITIIADGERGATHNLMISARNMADLMNDPINTSRGFARFNSKVSDIRTVISRNIAAQVKSYAPAM